ncbi:MarR family winged helix-turn-helix transcriptional regulator [Clostridium sp. DSM 100503]|uniref:MarR family winged helix-turn-helix transcriptional regulator n=1 Tax=Clostridium sp. DSM 100503 TaxID=2963282 RepID=UPI00214A0E6E|nr:MarR family winged helix-turn-helix transcriptional regulator [Clostridium sp. DSM 100503]MCR1950775.1 MarR family winged helix-turn-helix transcriptional regulator [Clostridium sp. DSM 100503]
MTDKNSSELYDAMQKLNRYMHRSRHKAMKSKDGIHHGKMRLLALISENDGIIQRDLAEMIDMRPSSMTEMLSSLEKNSLIKREQDEKDRRIMHVYLTEAGKTSLEEVENINDNLSNSIFNCLTVEEKEKMLGIINKVNKNLESLNNIGEDDDNCGEGHHGHSCHHRKCGAGRCHHHHG